MGTPGSVTLTADDERLPLSWLQSKTNKWPYHLTEALRTLMVEKDLFAVQRLNVETQAKLRDIAQFLKPHFAVETWDPSTERLLQEKVGHKIKRIRAHLLREGKIVRYSDGYIMPEDVTEHESVEVRSIQELIDQTRALSPDQRTVYLNGLLQAWDLHALGQVSQALATRLLLCTP